MLDSELLWLFSCFDAETGVFQLINKQSGPFTADDVEIMHMFLSIAGPIFRSSHLYESLQSKTSPQDRMAEKPGSVMWIGHVHYLAMSDPRTLHSEPTFA